MRLGGSAAHVQTDFSDDRLRVHHIDPINASESFLAAIAYDFAPNRTNPLFLTECRAQPKNDWPTETTSRKTRGA